MTATLPIGTLVQFLGYGTATIVKITDNRIYRYVIHVDGDTPAWDSGGYERNDLEVL